MSAANHRVRRITVLNLGRETSATTVAREQARRRAAPSVHSPAPTLEASAALLDESAPARDESAPARDESTPSRKRDPSGVDEAFVTWVLQCRRPDHQDPEHQATGVAPSPARLLDAVRGSPRPLPADAARKLGVPPGTTVGAAAAEVAGAVRDPSGPRCSSYPAALFYLSDRADLDRDEAEPRPPTAFLRQAGPGPHA